MKPSQCLGKPNPILLQNPEVRWLKASRRLLP